MPKPTAKIVLVYFGRKLNSVMRRRPTTWPTRSPKYAIAPATMTMPRILITPTRSTKSNESGTITRSHFRGAAEQPEPGTQEEHIRKPCHRERQSGRRPADREADRGDHVETEHDEDADAEAGAGRRTLRADAERHGEQREDEAGERPREFVVVGDQQQVVARRVALLDAAVQELG